MHERIEDLLAAVFPSSCASCDEFPARPLIGGACLACWCLVDYRTGPICRSCGRLQPAPPPVCTASADPGEVDEDLCGGCRHRPPPFERGLSMAAYRGPLRTLLRQLKFGGRSELARPLARRAHAFLQPHPGFLEGIEAIVPVPLPALRRLHRGYNQAGEIARHLGALLGRPVIHGALARRLRGRPQTGLTASRRDANARASFRIRRRSRVRGCSLLLLDDVWTTGATLRACARLLRRAGAREVRAFTLARVDFDAPSGPAL